MGGLSRVPRNAVNHHIVAESDRHPIDLNSRLRIDRFLVREVGKVDGPRLTALRLARLHAPPPGALNGGMRGKTLPFSSSSSIFVADGAHPFG
ncbi:hypothetical protein CHELA40_14528 [Chelatococcus asaccharovorans]|nr:hypothetical protein CHELA40_14528 [Chelatococcus asaccharovorans]